MPSHPPNWLASAVALLGATSIEQAPEILRAWAASTPLPPRANNPLGMPASARGAARWHGTSYASFETMDDFLNAFLDFSVSYAGGAIVKALRSDLPWRNTWAAVQSLGWPANATETDYPSAVLDNTGDSYRESIGAVAPEDRKTSGIVGGSAHATASVGTIIGHLNNQVGSAHQAVSAMRNNGK